MKSCENCDCAYILNSMFCVCTKQPGQPRIRRDTVVDDCEYFKTRAHSPQVPKLLDEIASHFAEDDRDLVLLADGNPLFIISKNQTVNEIELLLRVYCQRGHTYNIVEGELK